MADPTVPGAPAAPPPFPRIPAPPRESRALLDSVSGDAMADTAANLLFKGGTPVAKLRESMGAAWQPDDRTPDQIAHDRLHGVEDFSEANLYRVHQGAINADPKDFAAFSTAAAHLAADCGFEPAAGRSFISQVTRIVAELNDAPDKAELLNHWQTQLLQLRSAERVTADGDAIADMLALAGDNPLIEELKNSGVLRHPALWTALSNAAAAHALWKSTRPK